MLCSCKKEQVIPDTDKTIIMSVLEKISEKVTISKPQTDKVFIPGKCDKCNGIGYKGRTTISEVFIMDDDLREMIAHHTLAPEIRKKAIGNGMLTMEQDAILKVLEGVTTMEEARRVTTL